MFFAQDSPVSAFMKNLPPIKQPEPLRLSEMIDPFASGYFPLTYNLPHDNSFEESWFLERQENLLPFGYPGASLLECPKVLDLPENPICGKGSNQIDGILPMQLWDWKSLDSIEYEPSTSFNAVMTNTVMPSNSEQPSMRVQNPTENMDFEGTSSRRSLVYDTLGSHWNLPEEYPKLDASMLLESTSANLLNHQQAVSVNDSSSHRFLPGIGLKLDAASIAQCWSSIPHQITSVDTAKDYNFPLQNCSFPSPEDKAKEETNPSSHQKKKRKRRKYEQAEAVDSCMRCNCKKSKCLKLYCECFAAGMFCIGSCACKDCENTPNHEETVITIRRQIEAKNPFAFVPKLIKGDSSSPPSSLSEIGENLSSTPASARHTRGCNCKKSGCSKKYCECYQGGAGCSINCRCENCKNTFGRKDGGAIAMEVKCDEKEETNTTTQLTDKGQLEMSSPNRKRPSQSLPLLSDQATNEQPPCLKESDKDEMSEIIVQTGLPVQVLSPNKKRVTPPQKSQRLSSSRKLF